MEYQWQKRKTVNLLDKRKHIEQRAEWPPGGQPSAACLLLPLIRRGFLDSEGVEGEGDKFRSQNGRVATRLGFLIFISISLNMQDLIKISLYLRGPEGPWWVPNRGNR